MIQLLEILKPEQCVSAQKVLYFRLNRFQFSFDIAEAHEFKFFQFENYCDVKYHAMRFELSNSDAIALQEKIKELAN